MAEKIVSKSLLLNIWKRKNGWQRNWEKAKLLIDMEYKQEITILRDHFEDYVYS